MERCNVIIGRRSSKWTHGVKMPSSIAILTSSCVGDYTAGPSSLILILLTDPQFLSFLCMSNLQPRILIHLPLRCWTSHYPQHYRHEIVRWMIWISAVPQGEQRTKNDENRTQKPSVELLVMTFINLLMDSGPLDWIRPNLISWTGASGRLCRFWYSTSKCRLDTNEIK